MIIDDPQSYWIWIRPQNAVKLPKDWPQHGGKWLIFDKRERLDGLAARLDPFVEKRMIRGAKYNREPGSKTTPVMCVYCLDGEKDEVWAILEKLGVHRHIWKDDKQTTEDWKPGGRLYEERMKKDQTATMTED